MEVGDATAFAAAVVFAAAALGVGEATFSVLVALRVAVDGPILFVPFCPFEVAIGNEREAAERLAPAVLFVGC